MKNGQWIWQLLTVLLIAALAWGFVQRRAQNNLASCKENLKALATACEMYSTGEPCIYPKKLNVLAADYVPKIPICPAVGTDTYSGGFKSAIRPDAFTLCCAGHNHAILGIPPNYPQYCNVSGFIEP